MNRSGRAILLGAALLPFAHLADAASYVDANNRIQLTVTPTLSAATEHLAWQFTIQPRSAEFEISSIDAATSELGFSGIDFRQVNPGGQSTVFADFNSFFPAGEDATTDTQFAFVSNDLFVVPQSASENTASLKAAFSGFTPFVATVPPPTFAQIVQPTDSTGILHSAFAVRPVGGGIAELVEIGPIEFALVPGDFDFDNRVDALDLMIWSNEYGQSQVVDADGDRDFDGIDFLVWQRQADTLIATTSLVPEPAALVHLLLTVLIIPQRVFEMKRAA